MHASQNQMGRSAFDHCTDAPYSSMWKKTAKEDKEGSAAGISTKHGGFLFWKNSTTHSGPVCARNRTVCKNSADFDDDQTPRSHNLNF